MRALSSLVLVASSSLLIGCSLDTETFTFADTAGAGGAAAGTGGAAGSVASGAGGSAGQSGASAAGQAGSGGADPAGAGGGGTSGGGTGGSEAGAGGSEAGAGGSGAGAAGGGGASGTAGASGAAGSAGAGGATQTACTSLIEGASRCSGKTVETCTDNVWVPDAAPCALSCFQKGVTATCTVCASGDVSCAGDVLQTCKADGTAFTSVDCKGSSQICDPTLKACATCAPNAIICVSGVALTCNATGTPDLANGQSCGSVSLCEPGVGCKAAACAPGQFKCDAGKIQSCLADGTAYGALEACPTAGETCFDVLGCAECNQKNGTAFCRGDTSSTCTDGRLSTLAECPTGTCSVATGLCTACSAGSVQCSPDGLQIAICTNGTFPAPTACGPGLICDQGLGKCVTCHPDAFTCQGDALKQCDASGGTLVDKGVCGAGLCDDVQGRCDECKAGDRKCDKGAVFGCDGTGSYEKLETCATRDLCDEKRAVCVPPACEVGELSCGPQSLLSVCNDARTGFDKKDECKRGCVNAVGCVSAVDVFSGPNASCAIVDAVARIPVCWGLSVGGLLVSGSLTTEVSPQPVKGLSNIAKMAISGNWACALSVAGDVSCWGANQRGQLGLGDKKGRDEPTPVPFPGTGTITDISSAGAAICAVRGGDVYCWGDDADNTAQPAAVPTKVQGASNAVAVQVSGSHRCYTNTSGSTFCWGYNAQGQLGNGKPPIGGLNPFVPLGDPVVSQAAGAALTNMLGVTTGGNHACASTDGGATLCWGGNNAGQLALPPTMPSQSFVARKGGPSSLAQIVASKDFTCAIEAGTGALFCWGQGAAYQTGREDALTDFKLVTLDAPPASSLALGEKHGCVVSDGDIYCWGSNGGGQLGVGSATLDHSSKPVRVVYP